MLLRGVARAPPTRKGHDHRLWSAAWTPRCCCCAWSCCEGAVLAHKAAATGLSLMRPMPPIWAMPASWGARRLLLGNGPGWSAFRPAPSTSAGGASCTPGGCSLPLTASQTEGKASGWRPEATTWAGTTSPAGCGRSTSTRSTTPRPTTTTWRCCSCATPSPTAGSTPPSACQTATSSRTTACGTAALSPAGASPNPAQSTAPLSCWTSRWPWWTGHSACGGCTPSPGTWCALGSRRAAGMPARGTAEAP